jgi:hypothetical protein
MGRKSKNTVGDRVFGIIREARDGKMLEDLVDVANARDKAVNDREVRLTPEQFDVDQVTTENGNTNEFRWGGQSMIPSAVEQLARMVGLTEKQMTTFDPEIVEMVMKKNLPQVDRKVRLYGTSDGDVVRAFVSPDYTHIPSADLVRKLVIDNASRIDSLRVTNIHDEAEYLGADVIDIDQGFDTNLLGDPGPVPDNIVYPGWQFNVNDIGLASASLNSFLWVLVCNNGSAVVDMATRMRAIHKGDALLKGQLIESAKWKEIVFDAKSEHIRNVPVEKAMERMKKMAQRPPIDILTDVWNRIETERGNSTYSRYALAQAFGDTANRVSNNLRRQLQDTSGQLLMNSVEKVLPVLESLVEV